jgi:RNA polymerase subunit RPABC4/transcription elongation factor Spt4
MNCTTCGILLTPGVAFCPNCGTRVSASSSAGAPTVVIPQAPEVPQRSGAPSSFPYPAATLPPAYPPDPTIYAPPKPPASNAALVSLIFGILSWFAIPLIGAIVAVVAGHKARKEIQAAGGQLGGSGMATAGLILGYLHLALIALVFCAIAGIGVLMLLGSRAS